MVISRTPFRVSFAGGGTDLPVFYKNNGYGAVISTAIKQYMYIIIHPYFHNKIRVKYSKLEDVNDIAEIKHPLVRECLKKVGISTGVEIASFADVPSGTGLGSSSSFTVGLLNALYAYKGKKISKDKLAAEACEIEIDILGGSIGKQDQYAAAFGNLNHIQFNKNNSVNVSKISINPQNEKHLEDKLILYYNGGSRDAIPILEEQVKNMMDVEKFKIMQKNLILVDELKKLLSDVKFDSLAQILNLGWEYKKQMSTNVTSNKVNKNIELLFKNGATGAKLLGAGAAGFILVYSGHHFSLQKQVKLKTLPFNIDHEGSTIIFSG